MAFKTQRAKDFINLIKSVIQIRKPKLILADQYTGIHSKEFINFLSKNEIEIRFIATNCPQSNGITERLNQTITNRLRCKLNESIFYNQNNEVDKKSLCWPKLLIKVTEEYNDTPHSVTSFSPKYLLLGIESFERPISSKVCLEDAREIAYHKSLDYHKQNKIYYDKRHKQIELNEGDKVLI